MKTILTLTSLLFVGCFHSKSYDNAKKWGDSVEKYQDLTFKEQAHFMSNDTVRFIKYFNLSNRYIDSFTYYKNKFDNEK